MQISTTEQPRINSVSVKRQLPQQQPATASVMMINTTSSPKEQTEETTN